MGKASIKARVREAIVLEHYRETGEILVPVTVSNRHVHLDQQAVDVLFGAGHALTFRGELFQPGQYAAEETVTVRGPKGAIAKVRVLGPARRGVQVEVSVTDCYTLGIEANIRLSGDTAGTPGVRLEGPAGVLALEKGAIVAARHLHASPAQAEAFGFRDGDHIELMVKGARPAVIQNVIVRVAEGFELEAHVDTDEANSALLYNDILISACLERRGKE